jgi:CBS domain-containing protein
MTQVREIMTEVPVTVGLQTSLHAAAQKMRDADIGDVLITDEGRLCGVLTDRDLVIRGLAEGMDPDQTTVHSVCSSDVTTIRPDEPVQAAVAVMRDQAVRRLPVVDEQRHVLGVVSLGDLAIERDPNSALADISAARPNA